MPTAVGRPCIFVVEREARFDVGGTEPTGRTTRVPSITSNGRAATGRSTCTGGRRTPLSTCRHAGGRPLSEDHGRRRQRQTVIDHLKRTCASVRAAVPWWNGTCSLISTSAEDMSNECSLDDESGRHGG